MDELFFRSHINKHYFCRGRPDHNDGSVDGDWSAATWYWYFDCYGSACCHFLCAFELSGCKEEVMGCCDLVQDAVVGVGGFGHISVKLERYPELGSGIKNWI